MNLIIKRACVSWKGGAGGGGRTVTTESDILKRTNISLGIPQREVSFTDPAELIAAAHAGSFSMALSHELGLRASAGGEIAVDAAVTMEYLASGWTIMNIHLNVMARLPRMTQGKFIDATLRAKTNCLISKLLRANISMNAKLEKCFDRNAFASRQQKWRTRKGRAKDSHGFCAAVAGRR